MFPDLLSRSCLEQPPPPCSSAGSFHLCRQPQRTSCCLGAVDFLRVAYPFAQSAALSTSPAHPCESAMKLHPPLPPFLPVSNVLGTILRSIRTISPRRSVAQCQKRRVDLK